MLSDILPSIDYRSLYDENYFSAYRSGSEAHARRVAMYRQELQRIKQYLHSGRVLDVGCGVGEFLSLFDPDDWERYGIEVAPVAREQAIQRGISFELPDDPGTFDLVVYRGTLQHIDEPLRSIKESIAHLKEGGMLVFLATPNIGGPVYRLFQELPMLDPSRNFALFSDKILHQILTNFGLDVLGFEYPYLGTPYANPRKDIWRFCQRLLGRKVRFAFWKNAFECYARKPQPQAPD